KVAANDAVRRGRLAHSLKGLRADQVAQIEAIYREARQMGMHVDHIVPLAGCRVCGRKGAHVPENLQPLTAEENVMKGNRCMECWCREQRNAYLGTLAAERCARVAAGGG